MRRKVVLAGLVAGVAYLVWRSRQPLERRDRMLRRLMNERIAPALIERGAVAGSRGGLGLVEHVGRVSGTRRITVIHPVPLGERFAIPTPYADAGQWTRNVLAAGHCRLEFLGQVYTLTGPRILEAAAIDDLPMSERAISRAFGGRYMVLDVVSAEPGSLAE